MVYLAPTWYWYLGLHIDLNVLKRNPISLLFFTWWTPVLPFLLAEFDGTPSLLTDLDGFYVKIVGAEDRQDDILLMWGGPYGDICFTYNRKLQPAQMRRSLSLTCLVMPTSTRQLHYEFKCFIWISNKGLKHKYFTMKVSWVACPKKVELDFFKVLLLKSVEGCLRVDLRISNLNV